MRSALVLVLVVLSSACAGPSPLAPTAGPVTPATPLVASELRAYYEPLTVYAGGAAQVHVGTFARDAGGNLVAVYDQACTFTTDGGEMRLPAAGVDTSWHVAIIDRPTGGTTVHVTATCGALATMVPFNVAPDGAHAMPSPPVAGVCNGPGGTVVPCTT